MSDSRRFPLHWRRQGARRHQHRHPRRRGAAAAGKPLVLTLGPAKKYSTDPQRRYYFSVIVERICAMWYRHTGERMDDLKMHHWLMDNIGKWFKEIIDLEGNPTYQRRSYMDLSTVETEEHHSKCRQFGAQWGEDIPEPNEEYQPSTKETV